MGKREDNLMAQIAAVLEKPVEEIKELKRLYTEEEAILESQSILNYYNWRKKLVREKGETDRVWEARQQAWRYKICEGCKLEFAYSYVYDGIQYCSLDCLRVGLQNIGLTFSYGRPLNLRWGYRYPGIVPSSALSLVQPLAESASVHESSSSESNHVPAE